MAKFYLAGKTSFATIPQGVSLNLYLQRQGLLTLAAQRGIERQVGSVWKPVPIYYVPKTEDTLRIRIPNVESTNPQLTRLVQEIVHAAAANQSRRRIPKSGNK